MKKILFVVGIILLSSCSEQREIEKVAYGYLDAMGNYRIEDARPYASKETCEKTLDAVQNYLMPKVDTNYIKSNTPATIEILGVDILSDTTAVVSYKKTTPILVQKDGRLNMVKEEDEWRANVIINIPTTLKQDTIHYQMPDSLKNRKFMKAKDVIKTHSDTTK